MLPGGTLNAGRLSGMPAGTAMVLCLEVVSAGVECRPPSPSTRGAWMQVLNKFWSSLDMGGPYGRVESGEAMHTA